MTCNWFLVVHHWILRYWRKYLLDEEKKKNAPLDSFFFSFFFFFYVRVFQIFVQLIQSSEDDVRRKNKTKRKKKEEKSPSQTSSDSVCFLKKWIFFFTLLRISNHQSLITSCDRLKSRFWRNCFRLIIPTLPRFWNSISWRRRRNEMSIIVEIFFIRSLKYTIVLVVLLLSFHFSFFRCFSYCSLYYRKLALLVVVIERMKANSQDDIWLIAITSVRLKSICLHRSLFFSCFSLGMTNIETPLTWNDLSFEWKKKRMNVTLIHLIKTCSEIYYSSHLSSLRLWIHCSI